MLQIPDTVREALRQLAEESDFLLFGELHGTQEPPQLLAALLDDLTSLGYGGLALEIHRGEREPIMRWATGATSEVPRFFAQPGADGRGNEQLLALIRQVAGKGWQILCFSDDPDQGCATWTERDSVMADNLAAQWKQYCPGRKVVGVSGNLHSRLAPSEFWADLWPSFAACFQQRKPQSVVRSVDLVFHSGTFHNVKLQTLDDDPLAEADIREGARLGHSFALHLPQATAATFLRSPTE
jgi:hypothetical protein